MKKNNSVSIPGDMSNWSREELAFLYHRFVLKVNFTHNVVQNVSACIASTLWLIKPNLVRKQSITVLIISPPFDPLYSLFDFKKIIKLYKRSYLLIKCLVCKEKPPRNLCFFFEFNLAITFDSTVTHTTDRDYTHVLYGSSRKEFFK